MLYRGYSGNASVNMSLWVPPACHWSGLRINESQIKIYLWSLVFLQSVCIPHLPFPVPPHVHLNILISRSFYSGTFFTSPTLVGVFDINGVFWNLKSMKLYQLNCKPWAISALAPCLYITLYTFNDKQRRAK